MTDARWAAVQDERGRSVGAVAADYAAWRPSYPTSSASWPTAPGSGESSTSAPEPGS